VGRTAESGERQRPAQTPNTRALLVCDGEGGLEGFLGRIRIGGIAFLQDFAAHEMREWEIATTFNLECEGQRLVDACERAVHSMRLQLELRKQRLGEPTAAPRALQVYRFWRALGYAVGDLSAELMADLFGPVFSIIAVLSVVSRTVVTTAVFERALEPPSIKSQ
jgi:hypothetical protein